MDSKRILIFPGGMTRSLGYAQQARSDGHRIVGASSLGHDPARESYDHWAYLPYVNDVDFMSALEEVVQTHDIGAIYTPNAVVWDVLNARLPGELPGVRLVNPSPMSEVTAPYAASRKFAHDLRNNPLSFPTGSSVRDLPTDREIAALYHHVEAIPGMCDHDKIRALFSVFSSAPKGDVVEVGTWWGKSAFVLLRLACLNGVGDLLCVDPWSADFLAQDAGGIVDSVKVDADGAFDIFVTNLLPYANGCLNYLRQPSAEAAARYKASASVRSPEFGQSDYHGKIAVLHIDGNHSEAAVRADVEAWCPLVCKGGWIILDDYVWPYGDGPKRVGDEFLEDNAKRISGSFVMGSALFIKLADG